MDQVTQKEGLRYNGFQLTKDGTALQAADSKFTPVRHQTLEVFKCLSEANGHAVSKSTLFDTVWPDTVVGDDSLVKCISELRQILGDSTRTTLETIPKYGYRLISDEVASNSSEQNVPSSRQPRAWPAAFLAGTALLFGLWFLVNSGLLSRSNTPAIASPAIAVAEFRDLTGSDRGKRVAAGLTADLVSELARNTWLRLFQLSDGSALSDKLTGSEGSGFRLDGTLQSFDETLRISAQLKYIETDEVLWSEQWNKPVRNLFDIQDEIVERTNASLAAHWTGNVAKASNEIAKRRHPSSLDAYELYLLGIEHKHKFTDADNKLAVHYFKKAIEADPAYGEAWSALSIVHMNSWPFADTWDKKISLVEKQKYASRQAYKHLPNDPTVMVSYSYVTALDGDQESSDRLLTEAVERGWNNPDLLMYAAWAGSKRASTQVPVDVWGERGMALHSNPPMWYKFALANAQFFSQQPERALETLATAPESMDRLWVEAASLAALGKTQMAMEAGSKVRAIDPNHTVKMANTIFAIPNDEKLGWYKTNMSAAGLGE